MGSICELAIAPDPGSESNCHSAKYNRPMSINKSRGFLYAIARILGDINAVKKGTAGKRIARRMVGKATGRGIGKMFR